MTMPPPPGQDPGGWPGAPPPPGPDLGRSPGALGGVSGAQVPESCAFHPDRPTALHCTRCGRPACPECLTPASVGFHCRACVAEGRSETRAARTVSRFGLRARPAATFGLIAVNIVIFAVTALQAHSGADLSGSSMFRTGTLAPALVASGQWWRLLSSGFLHLSVVHVAVNMLSLYFLGVGLERILGRGRFLAVYLLALLGGSASVMLFTQPLSSAAGASGAIFGLMGGLVVVFRRFRYDMRQLLFVLALNLYLSFQLSGISWQAHLGGLFVGAAVTAAMVYPPPALRRRVQIAAVVAVLVLVAALVAFRDTQISVRCTELTATYFGGCSQG